jgi:hypothetical protein
MAYSKDGKIEASDINNLTTSINSTLTSLGQTNLPSVSQYDKVTALTWQNLISTTRTIASHQNTVTPTLPDTSVTVAIGKPTTYYSTLSSAITAVDTNKKNAAAQGTTVSNFTEASTTWSDKLTFVQTVTFANTTAATNFFNAGGQIALQFLHPASTQGIDIVFNQLGINCGTITFSGHNSGNVIIAGTTFNGVTKVGGGSIATTLSSNLGYVGLTTVPQTIFKQIGGTYVSTGLNPRYSHAPISYSQNYIEVKAYITNGGTTINFETVWDEVPNGLVTGLGNVNGRTRTTTYVLIKYPSTTYIANSWSSLSFTGSVTGS